MNYIVQYICKNKEEAISIFDYFWDRRYSIDGFNSPDTIYKSVDSDYPITTIIDNLFKTIEFEFDVDKNNKNLKNHGDFINFVRNEKLKKINN